MKPLIIYHAGCMDGATAALAAWLKFGEDAEYRPASYGDPAPTDEEVRGRDVYVLDFSYPREELERMNAACLNNDELAGRYDGKLLVLDHHKTAQADLAGLPFCTFDMSKSGAVLAWEHFHPPPMNLSGTARLPVVIPELFAYVQDRDLWRWELPHSREVSAALAASGALTDFRKLIPIYEGWPPSRFDKIGDLVAEGAAILRAERLMVERIAATAEEVELPSPTRGWSAKMVRALAATSIVLQSEVGEALALESARRGRDAVGVVYYRDGKSGTWRMSLRSRDTEETDEQLRARVEATLRESGPHSRAEIVRIRNLAPDVSAIAKSFGGGGHARAAGFECEELPWVQK
jgi:oligoribonuclease NrnB/cAMP/cGMP phosphodiesterase (DHH superfamily)